MPVLLFQRPIVYLPLGPTRTGFDAGRLWYERSAVAAAMGLASGFADRPGGPPHDALLAVLLR